MLHVGSPKPPDFGKVPHGQDGVDVNGDVSGNCMMLMGLRCRE